MNIDRIKYWSRFDEKTDEAENTKIFWKYLTNTDASIILWLNQNGTVTKMNEYRKWANI